jgi:hypothetical protein
MVQQSNQPVRKVIYLQSGKRTDKFIVLIVHFSWVDALAHPDPRALFRECIGVRALEWQGPS